MSYELGIAGLLKKHTCSACHAKDSKLVGPSFADIAKRNYSNQKILELVYKPNPQNWPDYATEMAPMSHVPKADVLKIAGWINGLRETEGLKNRD
jgi:cytochrome c551/c552